MTRKSGDPWAKFNLLTSEQSLPITVFPKNFEKNRNHIAMDNIAVVEGRAAHRDEGVDLLGLSIRPLHNAFPQLIRKMTWFLRPDQDSIEFLRSLRRELTFDETGIPIRILILPEDNAGIRAEVSQTLRLPPRWPVIQTLQKHPSVIALHLSAAPTREIDDRPQWKRR